MMFEIHMLKSFPPTNLNRDDTGAPKSCVFGGVQRGRISSQCLKRSWRRSEVFEDSPIGKLGIRTRKLPEIVCEKLKGQGMDDKFVATAKKLLSGFGNKDGNAKEIGITQQIVFYAPEEIELITDEFIKMAAEGTDIGKITSKELQGRIGKINVKPISLDIALFGRMVTSDAFADVKAAMQVAHAISTNKLAAESDYFTAVDDLVKGGESEDSGAGMIGDVEYNASCYYIYACIDMDQLKENLKNAENAEEIAKAAVPAVIEAMAYSNPSGKQNTFAGHVLPEVVMIEKKHRKIPVNYSNAFIMPAHMSGSRSLVADSEEKLVKEVNTIDEKYGLDIDERLWFAMDDAVKPEKSEECRSFKELISRVKNAAE